MISDIGCHGFRIQWFAVIKDQASAWGIFANQLLAIFLTKPTAKYMSAVDHLISYVYGTKDLAICYDGKRKYAEVFTAASDASSADNPDQKSSEGFMFCLFNGPIDWMARKQRTLTTSTTEAELLALSQASINSYIGR
jgi:hypothetical protein